MSKRGVFSVTTKNTNEERVHTPTSLFAKLFSYLEERGLIIFSKR